MEENKPVTAGFCRACLIKYEDARHLIVYSEKNRRLFVYTTGLQVKRNDCFLFQLCKDCFANMKLAAQFKKHCRASDKRFKTFVGLKKLGSNLDFCKYIKNADNSLMFRIPAENGKTVISPQKSVLENDKDEITSTSTSIRNFMSDLLRDEDIPASEARIIKEVIAEEADILEDSLDSHWLEDDDDVDDVNLDFSISAFSTPKLNTEDRYSSLPNEDKEIERELPVLNSIQYGKALKMKIIERQNESQFLQPLKTKTIVEKDPINTLDYIPCKTVHIDDDQSKLNSDNRCVIDKNLEMALNNTNNELISLDDLLKSPAGISGKKMYGSTTPFINNLLFGENKSQSTSDYIRDLDKPISIDFDYRDRYSNFDPDELLNGLRTPARFNEDHHNVSVKENLSRKCHLTKDDKLAKQDNMGNEKNDLTREKYIESENDLQTEKKLSFEKNLQHQEISREEISTDEENSECLTDEDNLCYEDFFDEENPPNSGYLPDEVNLPNKEQNATEQDLLNERDKSRKANCSDQQLEEISKTAIETEIEILKTIDIVNMKCTICDIKFSAISGLKIHFLRKHKTRLPQCVVKRPVLICDYCGKTMTDRRNLVVHIKTHAPKNKIHKCEHCSNVFEKAAHLRMHSFIHMDRDEKIKAMKEKKKFICNICGAGSTTNATLKLHMQRHTNDFKYKCIECAKQFHRKYDLDVHVRNHTGEMPFSCDTCKKSFKRRAQLVVHQRRHLTSFMCDICKRFYSTEEGLKKHVKRKCGRKPKSRKTKNLMEGLGSNEIILLIAEN